MHPRFGSHIFGSKRLRPLLVEIALHALNCDNRQVGPCIGHPFDADTQLSIEMSATLEVKTGRP